MPRKATWVSALLLTAICVVAIVRAQDASWRPANSRPPAAPAFLPASTTADAMPVAMQVDADDEETQQAVFGRATRRLGGSLANQPPQPQGFVPAVEQAYEEPRPLPMGEAAAPPPDAWQQPGPLPTRSVLRRPGQPASQGIVPAQEMSPPATQQPSTQQMVSDSEPSHSDQVPPRSVLKRPNGPVVDEAAPPIIPFDAAAPQAAVPNNSSRRVYDPEAALRPRPSISSTGRAPAGLTSGDLVVVAPGPKLRAELAGPQALMVGKPARYVINLVNEGDAPAEEVQLRLNLPAWISVESGESTSGEANAQADAQGSTRMVWNLPRVKANSQETLRLQVVAQEGQAFEITADWSCKPTGLKAAIAVRQPQLELSLAGPSDMLYGEEKPFTITVSNPGSGDADHVVVQLIAGGNAPQQIEVGTVPAGKTREVNVKVAANQQNAMDLKLSATADGNLRAEAAGRIVVKQAVIEVVVEGPPMKFAGAEATYAVTVSNRGNAAADDLTLSVTLPTGAKYLGGIDGATFAGSVLKWKAGLLPPETERTYDVRCQLNAPGAHRVVVQAHGPRSGASTHEVETGVEAVSQLKLAVNDPAGPAPVGDDITYEVQLMNRGTQAAKNVKVVMQFSEGLEPVTLAGAEGRVVPGQVLFDALPELGAGEQVVIHVKARADKVGAHRFRVEVVSTDNDTRLVSEGTTRFFADGRTTSAAARTATKPRVLPAAPDGTLQR
ncbi:Large cysteine-rich periplasmic protein OmcB [Anatilimnocola aggregata]|uniref:Large cysteine-rich periplasmic protein OmcB n=1 Tax=Anatilimnocola aggregata TaxID=2528021 RepID=A0A517YJT3_9BACT|nr:CARDB domain-containing protein [Anatilimnocola aggregata]QDU30480.1 Large cysteine-rich periplasmic protein OmcB [Anatilimnocola aggregata]